MWYNIVRKPQRTAARRITLHTAKGKGTKNEQEHIHKKTLGHGEIAIYDFGEIKLYAYKTNDLIDDEVFVAVKDGRGVTIELPCFFDNISELTEYLSGEGITVEAKLVAYHAAGASFLPDVPVYGTKSSVAYNTTGGGAGLVSNFKSAFGEIFDSSLAAADVVLDDGEVELAGIKFSIASNGEAYDIEIPEINCVYTHMMGHDCHSIVAGSAHADAIAAQLKGYIDRGFDLVLTSHYTPEDLKDAQTKIDYLRELQLIAEVSADAGEMKKKVEAKYPEYSGQNYLDMTVGFFFPEK